MKMTLRRYWGPWQDILQRVQVQINGIRVRAGSDYTTTRALLTAHPDVPLWGKETVLVRGPTPSGLATRSQPPRSQFRPSETLFPSVVPLLVRLDHVLVGNKQ